MIRYLIILLVFASVRCMGQFNADRYRAEVYSFMDQVLHDSPDHKIQKKSADTSIKTNSTDSKERVFSDYRTFDLHNCIGDIVIHEYNGLKCYYNFVFYTGDNQEFLYGKSDRSTQNAISENIASWYRQDSLFFKLFRWPNNFQHFRTISKKEIDDLFYDGMEKGCIQFSRLYVATGIFKAKIPYFNKDYSEAVFEYSFESCPTGNGEVNTMFYRKIADKWTYVETISSGAY